MRVKKPKQPRRNLCIGLNEEEYARFLAICEDCGVSPLRWHSDDDGYNPTMANVAAFRMMLDAFWIERPISARVRECAAERFAPWAAP